MDALGFASSTEMGKRNDRDFPFRVFFRIDLQPNFPFRGRPIEKIFRSAEYGTRKMKWKIRAGNFQIPQFSGKIFWEFFFNNFFSIFNWFRYGWKIDVFKKRLLIIPKYFWGRWTDWQCGFLLAPKHSAFGYNQVIYMKLWLVWHRRRRMFFGIH